MSSQVADLSIQAMSAWDQIKILIIGIGFSTIGFFLLGYKIYVRRHAEKVSGQLIGVRQIKKQKTAAVWETFYYPVYSYTLGTGQKIEATSSVGSTAAPAQKTGSIPLLVFLDAPENAFPADSYFMEIFGLVFGLPGLYFLYKGFTAYPFTIFTWVILAFVLIQMAFHFRNILLAPRNGVSFFQFINQLKAQGKAKQKSEMEGIPILPIAQLAISPEVQKQMALQAKYKPQIKVVLLLFGPLLIIGGLYAGRNMIQLTQNGLRTPGTVISLESRRGSHNSYLYYPVVTFGAPNRQNFRFTDKTGTSPPMYQAGEKVTVLYLGDSPEKSAVIDHGLGNWILPGILMVFGSLFLIGGLRINTRSS